MVFKLIKRFSSSAPSSFSDFLICGGGLIGSTVAIMLAKQSCFSDKTVTLIEANPEPTLPKSTTYSNRVSAISPFSKSLFKRLDVYKRVRRFKVVNKLKILGVYSDNFLELDNNGDAVAYIIENNELIQAISEELRTLPNVNIINGKNITDINYVDINKPEVILEDGSRYNCHLLIGSDGFNSKVRKAMGVHYLSWNYEQMGVVATLNVYDPSGNNTVAWQKFLPDGPVALLPLSNDTSSLVWSTTKEKAQNLLSISKDNFIDALNSSLLSKMNPNQLTQFTNEGVDSLMSSLGFKRSVMISEQPPMVKDVLEGSRAAFPLGFGHSAQYVCPHSVLIGDAAHRVHPLAGQGVNLGFKDIAFLEEVLTEGYKNGRELGDIDDLKKYERLCQQNNVPVMTFIELIHRVYTSEFGPFQTLGDLSLKLANAFSPLKAQINKNALFLRS